MLGRLRSRNGGGGRLRIFFATDLHGSEVCFRKFLAAAKAYDAQVLVLGGDLIGKGLVPLVPVDGGHRVGAGPDGELLAGDEALRAYDRAVADRGEYCVIVDADEAAALAADEALVVEAIHAAARRRLEQWVELAGERLAGTGVRCHVTGGNDDPQELLTAIPEDGPFRYSEGRLVDLDDDGSVQLASLGLSNPTPWNTAREVPEEELLARLTELTDAVEDPARAIFNVHVPPKASGLDRCPLLDTSTYPPTPVMISGEVQLTDAGSSAVRTALEDCQPALSLHGHIHESRGVAQIGDTLAVNPGSTYGQGVLQGAVIAWKPGSPPRHQFVSG